jgi:hypothetical protein
VAAVVLALGGCGSGDEQPRLGADSAGQLRALLGEVRGAAAAGDRSRALAAIDRFGAILGRLADRGALGDGDLRAFRLGARRVARRIQLGADADESEPSQSPAAPEPAARPESKSPKPKKAKPPKEPKKRRGRKGEG